LLHVGHLFKRQPFFKGILRSLRGWLLFFCRCTS
jgi:hypothetical protein